MPAVPDKFATGYENQSGLHALLEAVCARLRAEPAEGESNLIHAKSVRVLPEYHADLVNTLALVLGKKLGVLISVGFATVNADHKSIMTMLKGVRLEIEVYENVLFNQSAQGTKTSALTFAEVVLSRLHQWLPTATDSLINPQVVRMEENGTLQMDREKSDLKNGLVCYVTRLVTGSCLTCHCSAES